jgi:hypothetical protein
VRGRPSARAASAISRKPGWSAASPSGRLQMMARTPAAAICAMSAATGCEAT